MSECKIVIACATVIEEMLPLMPAEMEHHTLEFGLHVYPDKLRVTLQAKIDEIVQAHAGDGQDLTLLLGYGLCSQALVGVQARGCTPTMPRTDDCIAIFLGSRAAYNQQAGAEPGTYYLIKGWVEVGETPFSEFQRTVDRYGAARAERLFKIMLANYKRLALINTGQYELEEYRDYARRTASVSICATRRWTARMPWSASSSSAHGTRSSWSPGRVRPSGWTGSCTFSIQHYFRAFAICGMIFFRWWGLVLISPFCPGGTP